MDADRPERHDTASGSTDRSSGPSTDRSTDADLAARVRAIERALTADEDPPAPLPTVSAVVTDLESLTERVTELETTVAELEARQAAVEAYADRIEHVNDAVERRADAALAAVDRLESGTDRTTSTGPDQASSGTGQREPDAEKAVHGQPAPADATGAQHVHDAATAGPRGTDSQSDRTANSTGSSTDATDRGFVARLLDL